MFSRYSAIVLRCFGAVALAFFGSCVVLAETRPIWLEAELFEETGGWKLDTQFIPVMGSPFLLAHGLGRPVEPAVTTVKVVEDGAYRVWVRTRDWVAPWGASGQPGRFRLELGGRVLPVEFGVGGAGWGWEDGGVIRLKQGELRVVLRDLTGFDGRCDAVLIHPDLEFRPPDAGESLVRLREDLSGLAAEPEDGGRYDLVVCGGGYAGMAAAISAARQGLKVALLQDRFVLGGNGSSEVRVWANGGTMRGKYPHLGEIVEEFADHAQDSPGVAEEYGDAHKESVVRAEPNIRLFLGHHAWKVETSAEDGAIESVVALSVRNGVQRRFRAPLFVDATGHGTIGHLAGARYHMEPEGRMGMSNMWFWQLEDSEQPWPETPWALPLEPGDFPDTVKSVAELGGRSFMKGEWFWESGFDEDPIEDAERIRDWNLRAVFGAFSSLKRGPRKAEYTHAALKWVAYIGGTRESRLLEGDVVLSREDIVQGREFPDGCVATTWDIDLHYPKEQYAGKFEENPFISRAEFGAGVDRHNGYAVPYRCFYSVNVPNLFMAGRCISVTHEALGTVRVMRTLGMVGEVVGKAAWVCVVHGKRPRAVYAEHWDEMELLLRAPGAMRRKALNAGLEVDSSIGQVSAYFNKGEDRVRQRGEVVGVDPRQLSGAVVDDTQARLKGPWSFSRGLVPHVGDGYRYAPAGSGAEAVYPIRIEREGRYELRLAWVGHENRSSRTVCVLGRVGEPELRLRLDQKHTGEADEAGFHSLGVFRFQAGDLHELRLLAEGADGVIHADALQVIEVAE